MPPKLTTEQQILRSIKETDWQTTVQGMLRFGGWEYYHAPDNVLRPNRSGRMYVNNVRAGWPDLVAFRGDRRLALELKREVGNDATPEQLAWLRRLAHHGFEVGVFRPSHRDLLEQILLRGVAVPPSVLPLEPNPL